MTSDSEIVEAWTEADFYAAVDRMEEALPPGNAEYQIMILKEVIRRLECDLEDRPCPARS